MTPDGRCCWVPVGCGEMFSRAPAVDLPETGALLLVDQYDKQLVYRTSRGAEVAPWGEFDDPVLAILNADGSLYRMVTEDAGGQLAVMAIVGDAG